VTEHVTLSEAERAALLELYRQQVSAVRSLARILNIPCPIVDRDERKRLAAQQEQAPS